MPSSVRWQQPERIPLLVRTGLYDRRAHVGYNPGIYGTAIPTSS